jgi:hypothetical protein
MPYHKKKKGTKEEYNQKLVTNLQLITLQLQQEYNQKVSEHTCSIKYLSWSIDGLRDIYSNFDKNIFEKAYTGINYFNHILKFLIHKKD